MSSRDNIIKAIRGIQTQPVSLPEMPLALRYEDKLAQFCGLLEKIGGSFQVVNDLHSLSVYIAEKRRADCIVFDGIGESNAGGATAKELEKADVLVIQGGIAVAENGAIWIEEKYMGNRAAPFLCQELVVLIEQSDIVDTMQGAYERLSVADTGFGVFISGPSRTADIEQSLVIGAHGPIDLRVFILAAT